MRDDVRDGVRLDRGFQLPNPAYPAVARLFQLPALQLHSFAPGVAVRLGGRLHTLGDPAARAGEPGQSNQDHDSQMSVKWDVTTRNRSLRDPR